MSKCSSPLCHLGALLGIGALALFPLASASAQFATVINLPPDTIGQTVGANTQVNVLNGGALPNDFAAGNSNTPSPNLEVNVNGGSAGVNLRTLPGAALNLTSGQIGQGYFALGTDITIAGGRIASGFVAEDSTITMNGGQIGTSFGLRAGSVLNLTGGSIGSSFGVGQSAVANISGGSIDSIGVDPNAVANIGGGVVRGSVSVSGEMNIAGGSFSHSFVASSGSHVEISGGEFRLNGNPISGLDMPGNSIAFSLAPGNTLSGTLADGTPIAFSTWSNDSFAAGTLRLKAAALPAVGPPVISASAGPLPLGLRQGQTLIVDAVATEPAHFNAGRGSTVDIPSGGKIGNIEAVAAAVNLSGGTAGSTQLFAGASLQVTGGTISTVLADGSSTVNITGGSMNFLDVINGSKLTLTSGSLRGLNAQNGGIVAISGGVVGDIFRVLAGSRVTISGGTIGNNLTSQSGSLLAVSGGSIGDGFVVGSGSSTTLSGGSYGDAFNNQAGSGTRIVGGEFRLNGAPIPAVGAVGTTAIVSIAAADVLSGTFADGTPFAFSAVDGDLISSVRLAVAQLPPPGASQIDVPATPAPLGIRAGQVLTVSSGGLLPANFNAGAGSHVDIDDGATVGSNFEAVGATVEIRGGAVGDRFDAYLGSEVDVFSGSIGASFAAHRGSTVNIHGGSWGSGFQANAGSSVNYFGADFLLNGLPISGLTYGQPLLLATRTGTLTGRLADGSPLTIDLQAKNRNLVPLLSTEATLTLTLVPEPASALSCLGGILCCLAGRRRLTLS